MTAIPKLYEPIYPEDSQPGGRLADNARNRSKSVEIFEQVRRLLGQSLVRGFYGGGSLSFTVEDGVLQNIVTDVKQKHR